MSEHYRIRVKGHLADRWAARFDGFALTRSADGSTSSTAWSTRPLCTARCAASPTSACR
jgi:hypothetical protein